MDAHGTFGELIVGLEYSMFIVTAAHREVGGPYFTFHQAMRIEPGHPA